MKKETAIKLWPLSLMGLIVAADQITKALIVHFVPYREGYMPEVLWSWFDGFIRIIHTRNLGAAFSLGDSLGSTMRHIVMIAIPFLLLIGIFAYYFLTRSITKFQRWSLMAILGGGFGNLIDRTFRPLGVVDFIDNEFPNIKLGNFFEMYRWPTWNIADSAIVVGCIMLMISIIIIDSREKKAKKK